MMDSNEDPIARPKLNLLVDLIVVVAFYIVVIEQVYFVAMTIVCGLFLLLVLIESRVQARTNWFSLCYLLIQIVLITSLFMITDGEKLGALLFIPLTDHVVRIYSGKTVVIWLIIISFLLATYFTWFSGEQFYESFVGDEVIFLAANWLVAALLWSWKEAAHARRQSQYLLRELQLYVRDVEELTMMRERNQIARDLHDSVTQSIFGINLNAQSALTMLEQSSPPLIQVKEQIVLLQTQAQAALAEIRAVVYHLRSTSVEETNFITALRMHLTQLSQTRGITFTFQTNSELIPFRPAQQIELFRVVQEAINNIVKHAQVDHAELSLFVNLDAIDLTIHDDGVGFAPETLLSVPQGIGLNTMRERIEKLGGTFEIISWPNHGTTIQIHLSLEV